MPIKPKRTATLTDWFPYSIKPVRHGKYQARLCPGWRVVYLWWRDGRWYVTEKGRLSLYFVNWKEFVWRGIHSDFVSLEQMRIL